MRSPPLILFCQSQKLRLIFLFSGYKKNDQLVYFYFKIKFKKIILISTINSHNSLNSISNRCQELIGHLHVRGQIRQETVAGINYFLLTLMTLKWRTEEVLINDDNLTIHVYKSKSSCHFRG